MVIKELIDLHPIGLDTLPFKPISVFEKGGASRRRSKIIKRDIGKFVKNSPVSDLSHTKRALDEDDLPCRPLKSCINEPL